jgi:hypothetical protein
VRPAQARPVSVDHLGGQDGHVHSVLAMSTCTGDPLATIQKGETVRLHSEYNSPHAADDVMGIMLGYIHPS